MPTTIDARGLPCPQPVILTRNAIRDSGDDHVVQVSTLDQAHNVERLAQKRGWSATISQDGDTYQIALSRGNAAHEPAPEQSANAPTSPAGPTVVLITSDTMGSGDDALGNVLMRAFLHTLNEVEPLPDQIVLYNGGVRLAVEGSEVAEDLIALQDKGVEILACGTCLKWFELLDKLLVGTVSNMYTIAETLLEAGHIVRP